MSLTLSSRFEHDPSPQGVALAFKEMEAELCREIGFWASEVGNLVAVGLGDIVDRTPCGSRKSSTNELGLSTLEDDPDGRLGFGDIVSCLFA